MTYPPPPGGPPAPPPGNPVPPQGYPGHWGPQSQGPWPQQQWQSGPPQKKRGNGWKWALGAVALLAVVGVTVAVTVSVTSGDGNGDDPTPSGETYGLASADNKGPVNIITEDPSCAAWIPIQSTLANSQGAWAERDPSIPATSWTAEQRAQYEVARDAYSDAADQTVQLVKVTPHRVMRELYEQFIAYARGYIDAIPQYSPEDDYLSGVATASSAALGYICGAISYDAAQARAPLVADAPAPTKLAPLSDPSSPQRLLTRPDPTCSEWDSLLTQFQVDTKAWQALDANIPASDWTPEQRAVIDSVIPVMKTFADDIEELGRQSTNAVMQDFAILAAQYRRAYANALPTYNSADSYLARTANRTTAVIYDACNAVGA
ncbi:hypothetical protein ABGB19_14945 [Mycobacterium sp. B14F4]|uniref:hypothetical protein n=1 Tax=Mycobacterium sp. B14F4 TaxID=3153565 RepID=UPI00325DE22D